MSFLNKLSKGVSKAAEQAKFEADKMVRVNKFNSEISQLGSQEDTANVALVEKVLALHQAGTLQVPELEEFIAAVESLREQVAQKKADLESVKMEKFSEATGAAEMAPPAAAPTPSQGAEAGSKFCPNCGGAHEEGAKFCPSCGQQIG
jgi:membrane protease subunit (stomatin/prohibitin family)